MLLDAFAWRPRISLSFAMLQSFAINAPGLDLWLAEGEALKHNTGFGIGNNIGIRQTVLCTSDREVLEQVHTCLGTSNSVRQAVIAMLK